MQAVDKDHNGEISIQEYKLFFQCLGLTHDVSKIIYFCIIINIKKIKINIYIIYRMQLSPLVILILMMMVKSAPKNL